MPALRDPGPPGWIILEGKMANPGRHGKHGKRGTCVVHAAQFPGGGRDGVNYLSFRACISWFSFFILGSSQSPAAQEHEQAEATEQRGSRFRDRRPCQIDGLFRGAARLAEKAKVAERGTVVQAPRDAAKREQVVVGGGGPIVSSHVFLRGVSFNRGWFSLGQLSDGQRSCLGRRAGCGRCLAGCFRRLG